MKPNTPKRSGFTVYAILTTLTLLSWALYGAYARLVKIDLTGIQTAILAPLSPSLDTTTLDFLEKKKYVNEVQISSYQPNLGTQTEQASTESAEVTPTQTE